MYKIHFTEGVSKKVSARKMFKKSPWNLKKGNTCEEGHHFQKDTDSKLAISLKMNSSDIFLLIFSLV